VTLALVRALGAELRRRGVRCCHWKSNLSVGEALAGREDLDLLVDRRSLPGMVSTLQDLGFKLAFRGDAGDAPGIAHYYGLDDETGQLVHVHLFTMVLTGESLVKSHHLPLEEALLDGADGPVLPVARRSSELLVFVLRTYIKHSSLPDLVRLLGHRAATQREFIWLSEGRSAEEALQHVARRNLGIDEQLFRDCLDGLTPGRPLLHRLWLSYRVRRQLRRHAAHRWLGRLVVHSQLFADHILVAAGLRRRGKVLAAGGAVIAFVGPEATGKSTLVSECATWLGGAFRVRTIHAGKPPAGGPTRLLAVATAVLRDHLPRLRTTRVQAANSAGRPLRSPGWTEIAHGINAVGAAWDRRRLLVRARRAAARGEIVVCDRYPSQVSGAMDSPRLLERPGEGPLSTAYGWLLRAERRIYRGIPPPDVVLRLRVSLETAKQRNRDRTKALKEGEDYVEMRHRYSLEWSRPEVAVQHAIDTAGPLPETIRRVKSVVWSSL
jgi:thymidylate kinase